MNARIFVFVAIMAAALAWWFTRPKPRVKPLEAELHSDTARSATPEPAIPGTGRGPSPTPTPAPETPERPSQGATRNPVEPLSGWKSPLIGETPSLAQLNSEVEKDPHNTPQSLLDFSTAVQRMVDSVRTPSEGAELFVELAKCVTDPKDKAAHSVQAVCLVNMRDLSEKFPGFKVNYEMTAKKADPKVQDLIKDIP